MQFKRALQLLHWCAYSVLPSTGTVVLEYGIVHYYYQFIFVCLAVQRKNNELSEVN